MIHIVTEANRGLYTEEFRRLAELARGADRIAALEVDARTVHVLAMDDAGAPEFACRMRPTDDVCRLADLMPELIAAGAESVRRPGVWERLRIYVAPALTEPEPGPHRRWAEVKLAILEEAHDRGVGRIVQAVECHRIAASWTGAWRPRILGLPAMIAGEALVALEVEISAALVLDQRERMAAGPSRRLRLAPGEAPWAAGPKEIEAFLEAAQRLDPDKLPPLLAALRAAMADDEEEV